MQVALFLRNDTMVTTSLRERLRPKLEPFGFSFKDLETLEALSRSASLVIADHLSYSEILQLRSNSAAAISIADPKIKSRVQLRDVSRIDFALVGSVEHKHALDRLGVASVLFPFFPSLPRIMEKKVVRERGQGLTLFYHGNKVHLDTFARRALKVMDEVACGHEIVLEAHYNSRRLGRWNPGRLRNIQVVHSEWHPTETYQRMSAAHVGLVPNSIPARKSAVSEALAKLPESFQRYNKFGYRSDDYLLRFKPTSNPGRIYPFAVAGIPVIADFFPSSAHLIRDSIDGYLSFADEGWGLALEAYLKNPETISIMGSSLKERAMALFDSADADRDLARVLAAHIG